MNIINRIKAVEKKMNITDSDYCGCYEKHWMSELDAVFNKNPDVNVKVYPKPNFTKASCDMCGKSISLKDIETNKNVEEIYGGI